MIRVGIVGSRYWFNYYYFSKLVLRELPLTCGLIISGGAPGVDTMARRFAFEQNIALVEFLPKITKEIEFTQAAHIRNQKIVDNSDFLIAFPGPNSKGTFDTIKRAMKRKITIIKFNAEK